MKKSTVYKWFKIISITYVLLGVILFFTQKLFLFHGKKLANNFTFRLAEIPVEEYNIKRSDGSNLHFVKFLPNDTSNVAAIVIYYHGNRNNIIRYQPYVTPFITNGMAVYMQDYPGFGKSTGPITESIMKDDALKVYTAAAKAHPNKPILVYGKSMGTGLACYISAQQKTNRLILETPYYSLPTVYDDFTWLYPTKLLLKFHFNNFEMLPLVKAPITIFHGTDDALISIKNASKLKPFLKPTDEFVTIEGGNHNNLFDQHLYFEKLDSVLSEVTK